MSEAEREGASLRVWGPPSHNPAYVARLRELAGEVGAEMCGELKSTEVAGALAEVDLLVVPSIWYENSPLIILEALATRTPLAVSDCGGMAELVDPGRTGFHFEMGNAEHLAGLLKEVLADRGRLEQLYGEDVKVRRAADDAEALETRYRELVRSRVEADAEGA